MKTSRGALAIGKGVRELYADGQTDYSLSPLILVDPEERPIGRITDGDAVIFCCRRGEREVQLTEVFTQPDFTDFPRPFVSDKNFVILTLYHEKFRDLPVAFAPVKIHHSLSEVISQAGLRQLHISESEKFSHVTFFFNGGVNQPFAGENDLCIPSIKGIPFDQVPGLSLEKVAGEVMKGIEGEYDFIVSNFANGDVIGHTRNNQAKIQCAAMVDHWLGKLIESARSANYVIMVTADHGNLEEMIKADGSKNSAHTTNPVPFILIDPGWTTTTCLQDGIMADLAPTILSALGLEQPEEMGGRNLTYSYNWGGRRKVLLIILDGWGIGRKDDTNPIHLAETPVWDDLCRSYPGSQLQASGEAVGLKAGKAGNSEAGHLNIGCGRVVLQDDVRLDRAIQDGSFITNEILNNTIEYVHQKRVNLHLIGLLSEKSSHGSIEYPLAIMRMAKAKGLNEVYLHVIFDGRSTEPGSAPLLLEKLETGLEKIGLGKIVSGIGRSLALDRDGDYTKTRYAYDAFVSGIGRNCPQN